MKNLKLAIELVPESCWYNNLRNLFPEKWKGIRRDILFKAMGKCQICGGDEGLECHEIWEYDDKKHIQTLKGFIILCYWCHSIKHIGNAFMRMWYESRAEEIENKLIHHFMKVNKCRRGTFVVHLREVADLQYERNQHEWKTVMDDFLPKKKGTVSKRTVYIGGRKYER